MAKKKPYRFFVYFLARLGAETLNLLPRAWALALARQAGRAGYFLISRQRKKILENLKQAYGDTKKPEEMEAIGQQVMGHMLQTGVDFLRLSRMPKEKIASLVDVGDAFSLCKDILQEGKGLIIMTPHMGNWELLAGIFSLQGFHGAVVGKQIYYEPYNRWIVGLRQAVGVYTIYSHEAVRGIRDHLRKNEIIGLLPDQDMDSVRGVFVDFFGKSAYTSVAPVKLAVSNQAPILTAFLIRTAGDRYRLLVGKLIRPKIEGDRDLAIRQYTEEWMHNFEEVIRQHPEQWAWMHNRWKTSREKIYSKKEEVLK